MLCVCDSITDDIFQEHFEYTSGLFIDQARDTLDTTSSCQTTDCRLGDTLDVITQDLPVTLGTTLSQTFASFTTSRHVATSNAELQLMGKTSNFRYLYRVIADPWANTCKNSIPVGRHLMNLYQKIPDLRENTSNFGHLGKHLALPDWSCDPILANFFIGQTAKYVKAVQFAFRSPYSNVFSCQFTSFHLRKYTKETDHFSQEVASVSKELITSLGNLILNILYLVIFAYRMHWT